MARVSHDGRRMRSPLFGVLFGALLLLPLPAVVQGGEPGSRASPGTTTLGVLATALARVRVVVPGEGLAGARLGDRLDILASDWGKPLRVRQRGLLRRTVELTYSLDDFTVAGFRGRERLEEISLRGGPGSAVQTAEGARFGMEPQQLIQLYGRPPKGSRKGVMEYPRKGISFAFGSGGLHAMAIYPPRRKPCCSAGLLQGWTPGLRGGPGRSRDQWFQFR